MSTPSLPPSAQKHHHSSAAKAANRLGCGTAPRQTGQRRPLLASPSGVVTTSLPPTRTHSQTPTHPPQSSVAGRRPQAPGPLLTPSPVHPGAQRALDQTQLAGHAPIVKSFLRTPPTSTSNSWSVPSHSLTRSIYIVQAFFHFSRPSPPWVYLSQSTPRDLSSWTTSLLLTFITTTTKPDVQQTFDPQH
jgi:hypothetical protein